MDWVGDGEFVMEKGGVMNFMPFRAFVQEYL